MLILGLDTATCWGALALCEDEEIILETSLKVKKGGGEYLLAFLEQFLRKLGRNMIEIKLIAVGRGPGSYTGIRVGLATAAGLAVGLDVPVYELSTLRIIAENCRYSSALIAAALDARRGEVYGALYRATPDGLREELEPRPVKVTEFAKRCAEFPEVMVCGDGSKNYLEVWQAYPNLKIAPSHWDRPSAGLAARIAYRKQLNNPGVAASYLNPSYLKKVEAEIWLEEKQLGSKYKRNGLGRP